MKTGASVGDGQNGEPSVRRGLCLSTFIITLSLVCFLNTTSECATRQDLDNAIANLQTAIVLDAKQGQEVLSVLAMVAAWPQSITVGHAGSTGSLVALPIYYKGSTVPVSALQFDVMLSTGLTLTSVQAGLSSLASGKQVQANPVTGGQRIIIFGLNQVVIPNGPVAILNLNLGGNIGKCLIPIAGTLGSTPSGGNVSLTGKAGSVTKL